MKKFRHLGKQAYIFMGVFIGMTIIISIFMTTYLQYTVKKTLNERKIIAIEVFETDVINHLEGILDIIDDFEEHVSDAYLDDVVNGKYAYLKISDTNFDDIGATWSTRLIENTIYIMKRSPNRDYVLEISLDTFESEIADSLGYNFLLLNEDGQVIAGNHHTSIPDFKLEDVDDAIVLDNYVVKKTQVANLYVAIHETSHALIENINQVIIRILVIVLTFMTFVLFFIRVIVNRIKSDINAVSSRVSNIGEEIFYSKTESLIYLELDRLDGLIASIGKVIKERNEKISQINRQLEEQIQAQNDEVLDTSRQLEEEMLVRKKAEEEVKQINKSLESIVKERTKELEEANEVLNRNAKLAEEASDAKGKFLAVMSHEMRTPLNAIIGFSHMLSLDIEDESTKETLTLILNASKVLLSLINDVLDYAKYESGKMSFQAEKFNLKEDIIEVTESFRLLAKNKKLDFVVKELDQLDLFVIGDQTKIKQVLNNLLNNAMKFTLEGKIEVTFHTSKIDDMILVDAYIKDTGIGMTDETRDKLFEPFTQGSQKIQHQFGGTGLGLSITKEILEYYEGTVNFESEVRVGTVCRFSFKLPLALGIDQVRRLNYSRILYVEDNIVNQKLMQQYFNKYHLPYDVAFDGKEAVEKFKTGQFDLIFMDLQMPIMDGYMATERIREIDEKVYIIAMTAYTDSEVKERCKEIGINDYMKKPIDFSHLTGLLGLGDFKGNISHLQQDSFIENHAKKLSQEIDFDIDVCEELINTYLSQLKESFVSIEGLRLTEDYDGITRLLHKMKGGAATVRLNKIHNILLQAEILSKEGKLLKLFEVLDQVKELNILKK